MSLVDCPECGLPAEILDRFALDTTHGPVEHVELHCIAGHVLTPLVERLKQAAPLHIGEKPGRGDISRYGA